MRWSYYKMIETQGRGEIEGGIYLFIFRIWLVDWWVRWVGCWLASVVRIHSGCLGWHWQGLEGSGLRPQGFTSLSTSNGRWTNVWLFGCLMFGCAESSWVMGWEVNVWWGLCEMGLLRKCVNKLQGLYLRSVSGSGIGIGSGLAARFWIGSGTILLCKRMRSYHRTWWVRRTVRGNIWVAGGQGTWT